MPPKIAIRGLVKLQRSIEQRLQKGIRQQEEAEIRAIAQDTARQVEVICQKYRLRPVDLPAPSRQAYVFLQTLVQEGDLSRYRKKPSPPNPALLASFERVNTRYFGGELECPELGWSQRITRREFGRFRTDWNSLVISRTLSAPEVPEYVLDFVMFHELLHKRLGIRKVNGRNYSHTAEFRAQERMFEQYQQAKEYLEHLAASMQPNRPARRRLKKK